MKTRPDIKESVMKKSGGESNWYNQTHPKTKKNKTNKREKIGESISKLEALSGQERETIYSEPGWSPLKEV